MTCCAQTSEHSPGAVPCTALSLRELLLQHGGQESARSTLPECDQPKRRIPLTLDQVASQFPNGLSFTDENHLFTLGSGVTNTAHLIRHLLPLLGGHGPAQDPELAHQVTAKWMGYTSKPITSLTGATPASTRLGNPTKRDPEQLTTNPPRNRIRHIQSIAQPWTKSLSRQTPLVGRRWTLQCVAGRGTWVQASVDPRL